MTEHRSKTGLPRLRAVTLAVLATLPVLAGANPMDPTVQAGQASFSASGNTLTIEHADGLPPCD